MVRIEDGVLQVQKRSVIQGKLPLESAIGDPPVLLEPCNDLFQHLLKGHHSRYMSRGTMGRMPCRLAYQNPILFGTHFTAEAFCSFPLAGEGLDGGRSPA